MPTTWYVDKGLQTLINQMKAKNPGMTVWTIGDAEHASRTSDHNPEADGSVDGADFKIGGTFTRDDAEEFVRQLVAHRDNRIAYIIYDKHIISSVTVPWIWRDYHGSNPHTGHVHVSVNDKHENNTRQWNLGGKVYDQLTITGYSLPELHYGDDDHDYDGYNGVIRLQSLLKLLADPDIVVDGKYGPKTAAGVREINGGDGKLVNLAVWAKLCGMTKVG
jgi:hypothetical protein